MQQEHIPVNELSWVERNGFSQWALALLWLVAAFFLFQIVAGVVAVLLITVYEGLPPSDSAMDIMMQRLDLVFIGNTAGQVLFLGLATLLIVNLHTRKSNGMSFLRVNTGKHNALFIGIAAVLFIAVQPAIWYLGYLNSLLPVPDIFSQMQQSQYEMIENFLRSDGAMIIALLHIGVVPAVCEEILFRGYVMRAFEKSWSIWPAIIVSGFLFGLYHVQLANLLPLAALGILLALVTWLSNSIWPAVAAHFVNNGGAVVLATFFPDVVFADISPESAPPVWMLLLSIVLVVFLIRILFQQAGKLETV